MADSTPLLNVRDVGAMAGGRHLLSHLDLTLYPGEVVALRGASGMGKTTLLRTLAGLLDPTAGTIRLASDGAADLGWPAWRRRVMLVPQVPVMLTDTVADELSHAFTYRTQAGSFDPSRARILMDALGLDGVASHHQPRELSVGQQQRLALIRALLLDPLVLLLDEPTSALDPDAAEAVRRLVRQEVTRRGAAALVVSHDSGTTGRWCDRTLDLIRHAVGASA